MEQDQEDPAGRPGDGARRQKQGQSHEQKAHHDPHKCFHCKSHRSPLSMGDKHPLTSMSVFALHTRLGGRGQPLREFFARSTRQATRWRPQHAFQRINGRRDDPLKAGQVVGLAFSRENHLDGSIAKVLKTPSRVPSWMISSSQGVKRLTLTMCSLWRTMAFSSPYQTRRYASTKRLCSRFPCSSTAKKRWSLSRAESLGSWTMGSTSCSTSSTMRSTNARSNAGLESK